MAGRTGAFLLLHEHAGSPAVPELPLAARVTRADSVEALRAVIQHLEQELIACQRLALLGNLTAMVTHEFSNLLTPIVARAEAALHNEDDVAFMRSTLQRAIVQGQRAVAVTRHLLDLAHEAPPSTETCLVVDVVREALDTLTRPLEKDGIRFALTVPADLRVRGQQDLLCQVLLNLLLNARRAAKDVRGGGSISVAAVVLGKHAQIDVRDNGPGLPREMLDRLINPFLSADPGESPTQWQQVGLGLSVCRMIAHHHRAAIRVHQNEDGGCTIRLTWPMPDAPDGRVPS